MSLGSRSWSKLEDALQARDAHRAAAAQTRQRQLRVAAASGVSVVDCSGLSSQEEQSRMGRSLTESRRGATLYSASWPRGRPPERSAQRCGGRLPPSDPVEPRATSRRVLSPPPPPSSPSPPPPSPSPPPPSLSPRPPQQLGGLSYRGFPARLVVSLAQRPQLHGLIPDPARQRRRRPRHRGSAEGAHCAHERNLRSCCLTHTRVQLCVWN